MKNKTNLIKSICYILLILFLIIISFIFIPIEGNFKRILFPIIVVIALSFTAIGILLIYSVFKLKIKGKLKTYLLLTGISSSGILISIIIHNLIYGLFIYFFGPDFWGQSGDEPFFFILGIIIFPILFLIAVVRSLFLIKRTKTL